MKDGALYAGFRTVWADWAAHLAYANVFAYRPLQDWFTHNPLFLPGRFSYPFFADLISGLLMRAGVDIVTAFVLPSLLTTVGLLAALLVFYRGVLGTHARAALALTLWLCAGGLGFWYFIQDVSHAGLAALWFPPQEYTYLPDRHIELINFITSELLPQRSLLLGMAVGIAWLSVLLRWQRRDFSDVSYGRMAALGLIAAGMVVIHDHSLLALGVICAVLALFSISCWRHWLVLLGATLIPGATIFFYLHGYHELRGFFAWYPGWLTHPGEHNDIGWLHFWWLNAGLLLPLAVLGIVLRRTWRQPLVIAGLVLFALVNLLRFQPWAWDNTKLLTWSWLLLIIPVTEVLSALWSRNLPVRIASVILVAGLCASGVLDLWRLAHRDAVSVLLWDAQDVRLAAAFRERSAAADVVLCADDHHHWVSSLAGRQVIMSYPGWLFSYGIDYSTIAPDLVHLFAGDAASARLLAQYHVKFAVIGPAERALYKVNQRFFDAHFPVVLDDGRTRVYAVAPANSAIR